MSTTYYKILKPGGVPPYNEGSGVYHLPKGKRPGKWMPKVKDPECCERGYHVCTISQLLGWILYDELEVWVCEVRGKSHKHGDKSSWEQIRLLKKTLWSDFIAQLFMCDCAERVLPIYEKQFPNDVRPRKAIEVVRRFVRGEAIQKELQQAHDEVRLAWNESWTAARRTMTAVTVAMTTAVLTTEAAMVTTTMVGTAASMSRGARAARATERVVVDAIWAVGSNGGDEKKEQRWQHKRLREYLTGKRK